MESNISRNYYPGIVALLLGSIALFIFLALWSYAPTDGGFSKTGTSAVLNSSGTLGAWLADFLLFFLGVCAWLVPIFLLYWSGILFFFEGTSLGYDFYWRLLAWLIFLLSVATLLSLWTNAAESCYYPAVDTACRFGGWIGIKLSPWISNALGIRGGALTLIATMVIGLSWGLAFSWLYVIELIGTAVLWCFSLVQKILSVFFGKRNQYVNRYPRYDAFLNDPPVDNNNNDNALSDKDFVSSKQSSIFEHLRGYTLPPLDLLASGEHADPIVSGESEGMRDHLAALLKEYGVAAEVVSTVRGPVLTCFEVQPSPGVKARKITELASDLARSLAVSDVRVVELSPGKSTVSIEVPNRVRDTIYLRDLLDGPEWEEMSSPLSLALGSDVSGRPLVTALDRMPHLLVAGTTGSGKSVGLNAMLMSILYKATPKDVRFLLIDPKMLELPAYEGIPHLLSPVVTDMKQAVHALMWCVAEMDRRYQILAAAGVRDIVSFNQKIASREAMRGDGVSDHMPFIVVVIDEFADMMMMVGKRAEQLITRLAQKARAAGIHLILATQRPSVDVVTGLIKANISSRVAFKVSTKVDSRTVLDFNGAEALEGDGDMLCMGIFGHGLVRLHGAFIDNEEVYRVVSHHKQQSPTEYVAELAQPATGTATTRYSDGDGLIESDKDELYDEALHVILSTRRASSSWLQRRLSIGFNRAARLLDVMEAQGIVSAPKANGSREILVADNKEGS